jgi:hypothetical protein
MDQILGLISSIRKNYNFLVTHLENSKKKIKDSYKEVGIGLKNARIVNDAIEKISKKGNINLTEQKEVLKIDNKNTYDEDDIDD